MCLKFSRTKIKYLLLCLMMIFFACRITIANDLTRQSAVDLETQAKQLSKIWNGDEIRRSILLFKDASKKWKSLGEWKKASYCLREAAKLSVFISDNTNSLPMLKKALDFDKKINNFDGQAISYSLLSQIEEQKSNVSQRDFYKKKAIRLSQNSDDLTKAFVYLSSGTLSLTFGNPNEALEFLQKGLSSSTKTEEFDLRAHILLNIGIAESIKGNKNYRYR